ncbi:hypothetical protein [Clostridium botulinum]|uniref:hypothetical protein n=1 Tax=Clostridium botulinum TaxID=1491 RepID=UPI0004D4C8C6|nr:hypothetical protein [Clostridium botulinum]KEH96560.1 hypothetical protein Z953_p0138 [Clostridium botulinum D str. 16868]
MFKNSKVRNEIVLFISSYVPLYLIIFIQNISSLYNKLINDNIKINFAIKGSKVFVIKSFFKYSETYLIIICMILIITSFLLVKKMLNEINKYSDETFTIKILKINNLNYEYVLTYFSAYIFPFITLNLNTISGLCQFLILWILIGYVYIKNNLFYINPIINIFFKYNIYKMDFSYMDEEEIIKKDIILFTQTDKYKLENRNINVIKENSELYIEL